MIRILCICSAGLVLVAHAAPPSPRIPEPLSSHPGNVFLQAEEVVLPATRDGQLWRIADYEGNIVAQGGAAQDGEIRAGRLPAGYYELWRTAGANSNRTSLAVLPKLQAATPQTSPIGIDIAMAWLVPSEKMASVANLCALAGVNHVRDRLNWAELEPSRGRFAAGTRYDASIRIQSAAGLQVLTVNHCSPGWANPNGKRFPLDLRDTYNFHRSIAARWAGQVTAFEPWNEADISMFGGHTGSEMASMQKAAFLGLKKGNPRAIACLNVFAVHRRATLLDLQENEAWPYFDTYNLHHYETLAAYPLLYADHRVVSAGRPLWTTECSLPVKWEGDPQAKEPSPQNLREQSERLVKTFAAALHEGTRAVFYFILPDYVEGQTQFGILRSDLTPRPAFASLAAVGRLLADAKPLGRLKADSQAIHAYLFDAKPDGRRARVLVAWADQTASLRLSCPPASCTDHLGRTKAFQGTELQLSSAPVFVILHKNERLPLVPPPEPPKRFSGKPSPLVLQGLMPESNIDLNKSAYTIPAGEAAAIPVFLYNFGTRPARGSLTATGPAGWKVQVAAQAEIIPEERKELLLTVTPPGMSGPEPGVVRVRGDFGGAGKPVLSLRLLPAKR